jgi:hypothetical protein
LFTLAAFFGSLFVGAVRLIWQVAEWVFPFLRLGGQLYEVGSEPAQLRPDIRRSIGEFKQEIGRFIQETRVARWE